MRFGTRKVQATITHVDGTVEVTPDDDIPFDRLLFERRFAMEWMQWDALTEEYLYFLAWVQLHRSALAAKEITFDEFDMWMLNVAAVEFNVLDSEEAADAVVPTDSTVSTTS